jgi:signal transduction histidine kinase/putative methionine-R-sulfoxide reductase with GAF domain
MQNPLALAKPVEKPRFLSSLGMKMLLAAAGLLVLSFALCTASLLYLTRRMLSENLETLVRRDSQFISSVSQGILLNPDPANKQRLSHMAQELLREPEFVAISVLDAHRHVIVQSAKTVEPVHEPFSVQVPILSNGKPIGWVRAWYSPGLAFEEFWRIAGDMILVLLCGTLVLFVLVFLALNEWILARPFRRLLAAIETVENSDGLLPVEVPQTSDEWGMLATRLNRFLGKVLDLQEQSKVLYETSRLLGLPWELKGALEGILTALLHRYNLSSCLVFTPADGQRLKVQYASGVSESLAQNLSVRLGEGLGGVAYASATQRLVNDVSANGSQADPVIRELAQRQQIRSALFVPLEGEGKAWGVAAYFSRAVNNFPESAVRSLAVFTQQLAIAVRNAELMSTLKDFNQDLETEVATTTGELSKTNRRLVQKVRELKTIYDLALATAASNNVQEIVQVIVNAVKELVDVSSAAFFLFDKATGQLEPLAPAFDRPVVKTGALVCKLEESKFLEKVIREGQAQTLNFVEAAEQLPLSWSELAIRSILVLPLKQADQVAGIFAVINKTNGLFTDEDVRLLSLLTSRVTEVLNRLGLDQQLRQRVEDLSVLQDIALNLPSPPLLTETVSTIARISRAAIKSPDVCLFFLHHVESEALAVMGGDWDASLDFDPKTLTLGTSEKLPLVDSFRDSQVAYFGTHSSASGWEKDELVTVLGLQEVLYLPLRVQQVTIGVMAIGSRQKGGLTVEQRRIATLLAEQVAVMIERSRLYERLRSANEKLEQINHLKNEFISMVSHELRTPLTTIKGYVSIVLSEETGALKDQQKYFLETSDRAIDRLTLLVSDLLDISRLEAGQIQMQLRPVSLKDVVARVGVNFAPQLKAQGLTFTEAIPDKLPMLMADPHRLTQIFDNLMSNALKFTAQGGITISAADKGDFVMISVKDTGIGLPRPEQERIFEKFYQVKVGNAWPAKGTGLGLAIVKSIVESHRGKVWVESDQGKGADFRFLIPRARSGTADAPISGKLV